MELKEFCELLSIDAASVSHVQVDRIMSEGAKSQLETQGFVVLPDVLSLESVHRMRETWLAKMHQGIQLGTDLRYGEKNYSHTFFRKYHRAFEFYWNPPTCKLSRDVSLLLHYARNLATGYHPLFGLMYHPDRSGVYLAITHYPLGSGEMAVHVDPNYFLPTHFNVPLTHKGIDYREGGLMIHRGSEAIDIDGQIRPGGMLLFKGAQPHSIQRIDGAGSDTSLGRMQFFSIPTQFTQTEKAGVLKDVAREGYGRLKYSLYRRGIGFKTDHRNFR